MKKILAILLVSLPAGAQAMGMHGNMRGCPPAAGMHLAVGLYAVLAALGYWVLQHAAKETANYAKRAGQLVGWVLIVAGLAGLLCGVAAHARMAGGCHKCGGQGQMMTEGGNMPGMPENMEVMVKMKGSREIRQVTETKTAPAKKTEAAPAKK